jgi:chromosome segregation ATPase
METTSETLLPAEADETAALDLLETKIIAIVEQLQESRTLRERAEARVAELEETVNQLRSRNSAADKMQKSVRSRVESLLERIESVG